MAGFKNVIIGLQLQPNQNWTLSASHLINMIINLNFLPQTTNKAKFSLCRHKSGTGCVVWHWSLHTGSQAAIFPPTHQRGQSQASSHVALCLLWRRSWRIWILMFAKCIAEIILTRQPRFFYSPKNKSLYYYYSLFFHQNITFGKGQNIITAHNFTY